MPTVLKNLLKGRGLDANCLNSGEMAEGELALDASAALALYAHCPAAHQTLLEDHHALAAHFGIARLALKREGGRMGLGSFKALGATHAIAKMAAQRVDPADRITMAKALEDMTFVCCSAGNHGLSMAAGAALFGAKAVVVLAHSVPEDFALRLAAKGAEVIRHGADYEEGMAHSRHLAKEHGWFLLSDGSWQGYSDPARNVMEGYLIMGHEAAQQWLENTESSAKPTHVILQAGVGGLAAAAAASARTAWGNDVMIVIVEPDAAPALLESVQAGHVVDTVGPVSSMGRLDCKTPSHLALKYLAQEADVFITLSDEAVEETVALLEAHTVPTSPSGGAGVSVLHHLADRDVLELNEESRVLVYISEGAI